MPSVAEAVQYAEAGFPIFPVWGIIENRCQCGKADCKNPGKHPITGRGVLDATTNIRQIRVWWGKHDGANIGLATGEQAGVIVLDVDGPEGLASLADKAMPTTRFVATGKGVHYYFNHPGFKVKNSVRKLGKGLDIRSDGGYVIAPPSKHASGSVYTWNDADAELADIPLWLREALLDDATGAFGGDDSVKIELGGRNTYLTSKAGTLRRAGFGIDAIRAALIQHNAAKCEPPLDSDEIEKIVQSIGVKDYDSRQDQSPIGFSIQDEMLGDKAPSELCRTAPHTDVGNAEVFASLYGPQFRFDHTRKRWMVWFEGSGVWREDFTNAAHRAMIASVRIRKAVADTITDDAERESLRKCVAGAERNKGIAFALEHAKTFTGLATKSNDFDIRPELLNFLNGTLNLDTDEFTEANRNHMISRQMATRYDATARAPRWEEAVRQIFNGDANLIAYVQRALGYSLSGQINEQAFFIGHGNGANGKSTLLNTVRSLMGDYASTTAFATFDSDNKNQYGNDLAALKGRRFVIAIEAEQSKRLAEARVKTVTGGEPVSCRFLYGEFFEMVPEFKVWLAVNHKPIIRGTDHGIWRRIHLIPFEVTFGSEEDVATGRAQYIMDRTLDGALQAEWPGIANWLIQGYKEWRRIGLRTPASIIAATKEYKKENDNVALWIDERCMAEKDAVMPAAEGYEDFRDYLTRTGEIERAIPSMRVWGTMMAEKGFQKKRTERGYVYKDVKIQPVKLNENRGN